MSILSNGASQGVRQTASTSSNDSDDLTRTTMSNAQQGLDVLQMRLTFNVSSGSDTRSYTFERPVPRKHCEVNCNREAAFEFVNSLIGACEREIVASQAWRCAYCGGPATHIYSSPFVDFNARPPSVISHGSQPVCGVMSLCHALANKASMDKLNEQQANGMTPRPALPSEDWVVHIHSAV